MVLFCLKRLNELFVNLGLLLGRNVRGIVIVGVVEVVVARHVVVTIEVRAAVPTPVFCPLLLEFLVGSLELLVSHHDFVELHLGLLQIDELAEEARADRLLQLIGVLEDLNQPVTVGTQVATLLYLCD